ncbi:MAG TPA: type VI secretion system tip protein TssI/VgrG, partial [Candidatus Nanopelagicales bacterium]|nr:type VI secretion system tip protein TssI/VgrG [Candidatus Nanopelagicales bacterium]
MSNLELSFACGEDSLSVRRFAVHEAVSSLFTVSVMARSKSPAVDLSAIVGKPATFRIESGLPGSSQSSRTWTGVVCHMEQVHAVQPSAAQVAESTYALRIVPELWVLTQRRNHRIYQHISIPDITDRLLTEWNMEPAWQIDRGSYPKLEYKVQYGESDYAFLCRLWEEAGIAFTFPEGGAKGSKLTLGDKLQGGAPRAGGTIRYVDSPSEAAEQEYISRVRLSHEVRPGAHIIRDHDFRNPAFQLLGEAPKAGGPEDRYEQFHYQPGATLIETGKGGGTPFADDKGVARYDQSFAHGRADRALGGDRAGRRAIAIDTNCVDLAPGVVFSIDNHPHPEINEGAKLVMTELTMEGAPGEQWTTTGSAVFTDVPYRPQMKTPKPQVFGVQSATVVGPAGEEIHTDEFGRVRVQFPWDREGKSDDGSSCWIRVSQGWGGMGFGVVVLPRIGQEVLVGFLGGDPDQPIIVGRVYNATAQVPYKLPDHKTRSAWKSDSSPGHDGFNEIMFEDLKGKELVWEQAQKNRRRLVKNDEFITVGQNRQKLVKADEQHKVDGNRKRVVGGEEDVVVKKSKRERVEGDSHLRVVGSRSQRVEKSQSLTVKEDQQEVVGNKHALTAGREIHIRSGDKLVIEAG